MRNRKFFLGAFIILFAIIAHPAYAALTIDGTASGSAPSGNTLPATLTTSNTNDIIICSYKSAIVASTITGIADSPGGLTWTKRQQHLWNGGLANAEEWSAKSSSALTSDVITATLNAAPSSGRFTCFGVSGANFASPFDSNVSIPANSGAGCNSSTSPCSVTISTSNGNDMLLSFLDQASTSVVTVPSGFSTVLHPGTITYVDEEVVSSTQSSLAVSYSWTGAPASNSVMVDAIQAASTSSTQDMLFMGAP